MFGPPGSGKGTQAAMISAHFGIKHVSFGDLLRKHISEETSIGKSVKNIISNGGLVGIDIMKDILYDVLDSEETENGIILDGFPRNIEQAILLDRVFEEQGKNIHSILHLVVSDNTVRERIAHRAKIENRIDDQSLDKINNRIEVYKNETSIVHDYYKLKVNIYSIDAENEINNVLKQIISVLETSNLS